MSVGLNGRAGALDHLAKAPEGLCDVSCMLFGHSMVATRRHRGSISTARLRSVGSMVRRHDVTSHHAPNADPTAHCHHKAGSGFAEGGAAAVVLDRPRVLAGGAVRPGRAGFGAGDPAKPGWRSVDLPRPSDSDRQQRVVLVVAVTEADARFRETRHPPASRRVAFSHRSEKTGPFPIWFPPGPGKRGIGVAIEMETAD